jgi:hypothetical protein
MSNHPSAPHLDRRDLIKAGILAGLSAVLPLESARAELPQVARDRTIVLVWGGRDASDLGDLALSDYGSWRVLCLPPPQ